MDREGRHLELLVSGLHCLHLHYAVLHGLCGKASILQVELLLVKLLPLRLIHTLLLQDLRDSEQRLSGCSKSLPYLYHIACQVWPASRSEPLLGTETIAGIKAQACGDSKGMDMRRGHVCNEL